MIMDNISDKLTAYNLDYKEEKRHGNLEVEDGEYAISHLSNIRGTYQRSTYRLILGPIGQIIGPD